MSETGARLKNLLSLNELEIIKGAFKEHQEGKFTVNLSVVAKESNLVRSVGVVAMRLLEAGGIIFTRSQGIKGLYIEVIKPDILKEIIS